MKLKYLLLVVFLAALTGYTYRLRADDTGTRRESHTTVRLSAIPLSFGEYRGQEEMLDERLLAALAADQAVFRTYHGVGRRPMWLFMGYFEQPTDDSQIHSPKHCYPGAGWDIHRESSISLEVNGLAVEAKELLITNGSESQLVYYWFLTDTGILTNEYALKWDMMKNALLGRSQCSTFVRFSTRLESPGDEMAAARDLRAFVETIAPYVHRTIRGEDMERET